MLGIEPNQIRLFCGRPDDLSASMAAMQAQPVDAERYPTPEWQPGRYETTLAAPFTVAGPATYSKGRQSVLQFAPSVRSGWWLQRLDLPEQLPIEVSPSNVWTARRSIVLRSGCPDNYVRMTEHIIAHRYGLGLDNVLVSMQGGDPPLFDLGSVPIVDGIRRAGLSENLSKPLLYQTVKEPVAIMNQRDGFLLFLPASDGDRRLHLDVAIDFPTAIGQQRIKFILQDDIFCYGAQARTNCSAMEMLMTKTVGKLFADIRNLGYNRKNILVAAKKRYVNTPGLLHHGKSLEAVWHRSCLDLVAALSLLGQGRLAGHIFSYKAGHELDVRLVTLLQIHDLLQPV